MMKKIFSKLGKSLAFGALYWIVFLLGVLLFFPMDTLTPQLETILEKNLENENGRPDVEIAELSTSGIGVELKGVHIAWPTTGDAIPVELDIQSLELSTSFFGLLDGQPDGGQVSAKLYGGQLDAEIGLGDKNQLERIQAEIKGVDLGQAFGDDAYLGTPLAGVLAATIDLDMGKDPSKEGQGQIKLNSTGLTLGPGAFPLGLISQIPGAAMGAMVLQNQEMGQVMLGNLMGTVEIEKGRGTIKDLGLVGGDLEAVLNGSIRLSRRLNMSTLRLEGTADIKDSLKAKDGFDTLMPLASSFIDGAKDDSGKIPFSLTGALRAPRFKQGALRRK